MHSSDFTYQILQLTDEFYHHYPNPPYVEILKKKHRAYNCLLFSMNDYSICIPYRSVIMHPYAYHFTSTKRSKASKSGLDYSKIVVIKNLAYVSDIPAIIDDDEYVETIVNVNRIAREAFCFVTDYIDHIKGTHVLHPREFTRRYQYSPLIYFHDLLNL